MRFPIVRTIVAFLFYLTTQFINIIALLIVNDRVPLDVAPLPDLSFSILPEHHWVIDLVDYIMNTLFFSSILIAMCKSNRQIILRRLFVIVGIIYLYRFVCVLSTVLPLPSPNFHCAPLPPGMANFTISDTSRYYDYAKVIFDRLTHMKLGSSETIYSVYCGDSVFSGHCCTMIMAYMIYNEYIIPKTRKYYWIILDTMIFIAVLIGVMCILISRLHYLLDVILAYFVTTRIFWIYHAFVNNHEFAIQRTNYKARVWWWPIFIYIEQIDDIIIEDNIKDEDTVLEIVVDVN